LGHREREGSVEVQLLDLEGASHFRRHRPGLFQQLERDVASEDFGSSPQRDVEDTTLFAGATSDIQDSHARLQSQQAQHPLVDVSRAVLPVDVDSRLQVFRRFPIFERHHPNLRRELYMRPSRPSIARGADPRGRSFRTGRAGRRVHRQAIGQAGIGHAPSSPEPLSRASPAEENAASGSGEEGKVGLDRNPEAGLARRPGRQ
jgi:hypothetical protein